MAATDIDYRLKKRVILNVAVLYLPTYTQSDDQGMLETAESMLEEHNIGMRMWPESGKKEQKNTLPTNYITKEEYKDPIPDTREAYQALRKDVNTWIKNVARYPHIVPVIFCKYDHSGFGITPPATKTGNPCAACLIYSTSKPQKDKVTVLHEMGHAANCNHTKYARNAKNFMHEADGRDNIYKFQVEKFAVAAFASYS